LPCAVESLVDTAELTRTEQGILATVSTVNYIDQFSRLERRSSPESWRPRMVERERKYSSRGQILTLKWRDVGQALPTWFDPVMQGFADLITLEPNWDSYHAKAIDKTIIQNALATLDALLTPASPAPSIVPLSSGGLQIEWHHNEHDLELVLEPRQRIEFYYKNSLTGAEEDGPAASRWTFLIQLVRALE